MRAQLRMKELYKRDKQSINEMTVNMKGLWVESDKIRKYRQLI